MIRLLCDDNDIYVDLLISTPFLYHVNVGIGLLVTWQLSEIVLFSITIWLEEVDPNTMRGETVDHNIHKYKHKFMYTHINIKLQLNIHIRIIK